MIFYKTIKPSIKKGFSAMTAKGIGKDIFKERVEVREQNQVPDARKDGNGDKFNRKQIVIKQPFIVHVWHFVIGAGFGWTLKKYFLDNDLFEMIGLATEYVITLINGLGGLAAISGFIYMCVKSYKYFKTTTSKTK